jgi:hypothetical protein
MQSSFWDSLSKALTSPAGQFAFGLGLFYGVQKFFEAVENKLTLDAKIHVWMWLSGFTSVQYVRNWPSTFAAMFDRVFGDTHLNWRCFWRSTIASYSAVLVVILLDAALAPKNVYTIGQHVDRSPLLAHGFPDPIAVALQCNADFISLLETRVLLRYMAAETSSWRWGILLTLDYALTAIVGLVACWLGSYGELIGNALVVEWIGKHWHDWQLNDAVRYALVNVTEYTPALHVLALSESFRRAIALFGFGPPFLHQYGFGCTQVPA